MSPASYRAAPPRVGSSQVTRRPEAPPTTPVTAPSHRSQGHARLPGRTAAAAYSPLVAWDEAASMFAGQPQPVEIHHRGIWYTGELIGWRHESNGRVAARVRCRRRRPAALHVEGPRRPPPARPQAPAALRVVPGRRPPPGTCLLPGRRGRRDAAARPAGRDAYPPREAGARHDTAGTPCLRAARAVALDGAVAASASQRATAPARRLPERGLTGGNHPGEVMTRLPRTASVT